MTSEELRAAAEKATKALIQIQLKVHVGESLTLEEQRALWNCFETAMTNVARVVMKIQRTLPAGSLELLRDGDDE
jgi:hypothetical protein